MARRSDHSREELYALAMSAAQSIVEKEGYRALTARKVAVAIGYSPGTLYNLFVNLDDLVMHVNARTLDGLKEAFQDSASTGDWEQDIDLLLNRYMDYVGAHAALWSMLLNYNPSDGYEVPEWYERRLEGLLAAVETALAPVFGPVPPEVLSQSTRILWASLHGIAALSQTGKLDMVTQEGAQEMSRALVRNFVLGVRAQARDQA